MIKLIYINKLVLWAKYVFLIRGVTWSGPGVEAASFRPNCACWIKLEAVLLVLTVPGCLNVSMEPDRSSVGNSRLLQLVCFPATETFSKDYTHTHMCALYAKRLHTYRENRWECCYKGILMLWIKLYSETSPGKPPTSPSVSGLW
jgi:hypothetical protein